MVDRSQGRFKTEELGVPVASFFVVDARTQHTFLLGTPRHRKKAIPRASPYQVGLWKKAAKLDNPSDAVLRERGARRRSWGTKAKPLACNPPTALLSARAMPARRFRPPWSVEEQDAAVS